VKPIKMLGLAALAALLAMALVGTSSAMAESTELCGSDPGTGATEACGSTQEAITHVHETTEAGNPGLLLSSVVEIKCTVLFLGDTVGTTSNPLEIKGKFTYSGCQTASGSSCTVTEVSTESTIKVLKTAHELGEVTGSGEVNAHCGFFINCTYNGEGLNGHALGPLLSTSTNGQVRIEEQTTHKVSGSLCPETAKLDLLTTPLEAVYLTKPGALHYCVEYVNGSTGFFLNSACTVASRDGQRSGKFMLVVGPAGESVGKPLCAHLTGVKIGLYKDSVCTSDDGTNKSEYEKGIIKTVQ
jgi:hypothetical protein